MSILNGKETFLLGLKGDSCFVRFSAYSDGRDFTETPEGTEYFVGFATAQTAPTEKEKYKWIYIGGGAEGVGISPVVEVTPIDGGNRVTITDIFGAKTFVVLDGADGKDGKDGANGKDGIGTNGTNGKDGKDGATPVRGTDYWTESDKAEIVADVISALGIYNGESEDL